MVSLAILRLLLALAAMAIEHDRGFMSRKAWLRLTDAMKAGQELLNKRSGE